MAGCNSIWDGHIFCWVSIRTPGMHLSSPSAFGMIWGNLSFRWNRWLGWWKRRCSWEIEIKRPQPWKRSLDTWRKAVHWKGQTTPSGSTISVTSSCRNKKTHVPGNFCSTQISCWKRRSRNSWMKRRVNDLLKFIRGDAHSMKMDDRTREGCTPYRGRHLSARTCH